MVKKNAAGFPYVPIPEEIMLRVRSLEDSNLLNINLPYRDLLDVSELFASVDGWLQAYQYDLYGSPPPDGEHDPEQVADLFERLARVKDRILLAERAEHIIATNLANTLPPGASNETWHLYAMSSDPISIREVNYLDGYPMLLRQLRVAGVLDEKILVYAPVWVPTWLHSQYVSTEYVDLGPDFPSEHDLAAHEVALRLWSPHRRDYVFHDYLKAFAAAKKTWQHTPSTYPT